MFIGLVDILLVLAIVCAFFVFCLLFFIQQHEVELQIRSVWRVTFLCQNSFSIFKPEIPILITHTPTF